MSQRYLLPADVALIPASQLDPQVRAGLKPARGDVALDRPLLRASPKLVDANTAALLREFSSPRSLAEGIVRLASKRGVDPLEIASTAHDALARVIAAGILVEEGSALAGAIVAQWRTGEVLDGFTARECVRLMSDVELHQAIDAKGSPVALKLWREGSESTRRAAHHEATMLQSLEGTSAPKLVADGSSANRPYVAMEWRRGIDALVAADEDEMHPPVEKRARRWQRACTVADAYTGLHEHGMIHGDVHEGNVLLDRNGAVTLLDFGLARRLGVEDDEMPERGGVMEYFEPEYALAELQERAAPATSYASEQYALAAMLFRMVSGAHYLEFAVAQREAMKQVAEQPPRSFSSCGALPWPALELVLRRGLEKDPAARFPSMREFAAALRAARPAEEEPAIAHRKRTRGQRKVRAVARIWTELGVDSVRYDRGLAAAPRCSIALGAAGVALAWYRRALLTDSASHLAVARQWAALAESQMKEPTAFHDGDELTREIVGSISVQHGATGVWLVTALVAHALGDAGGVAHAVRGWSRAVKSSRPTRDLTLGRAGTMLSASILLEAVQPGGSRGLSFLTRRGNEAYETLWRDLSSMGAIGVECTHPNLGIAHGWAGMLYAMLRWRATIGASPANAVGIRTRLGELAGCAEPSGRGLRWPWRDEPANASSSHSYASGWCNGSAGFVHLWLEAHAAFGDVHFLELAEGSAWHAWECNDGDVETLCCGLAGRAYALLAMYRATGDPSWWTRARDLAQRAVAVANLDGPESLSLYRGSLSVALLLEEMEHPHAARMPGFESDGWTARA